MGISINTGDISIPIERNGKEVGSVRFSASDPTLLLRLRELSRKTEALYKETTIDQDDLDKALDQAEALDKKLRAMLDEAFGNPVSDIVFGDSFCFASYNGETAMEQFLSGVMPIIQNAMKTEGDAVEKRRAKYLEKYQK